MAQVTSFTEDSRRDPFLPRQITRELQDKPVALPKWEMNELVSDCARLHFSEFSSDQASEKAVISSVL